MPQYGNEANFSSFFHFSNLSPRIFEQNLADLFGVVKSIH